MLIQTEYRSEGFYFQAEYKRKILRFPIDSLDKGLIRSPDWPILNTLEQLYFQGLLQPLGDGFLLTPEDFYMLESEVQAILPIPHAPASLCLEENYNIGAKQYSISWYLTRGGKNAGRTTRKGCVALASGLECLLSVAQYRLVREIEAWQDDGSLEMRGRFQAKCKYLAKRADVQLSQFTQDRDFLFADHVLPQLENKDDHEIHLTPDLPDLPSNCREALPDRLQEINQLRSGRRQINIFAPPDVAQQYNIISEIPDIRDSDVPRFIKNPLQFLPEALEFDADDFSRRVKGLKVRTAQAVPYIQIDKSQEDEGWFPVSCGTDVVDDGETASPEIKIDYSPELEKLIRRAAENGEEYIYYDQTWIKVDPARFQTHFEAQDQLEAAVHDEKGRLKKEDLSKILDIYQNLDGIEYDERPDADAKPAPVYPLPVSLCATLKDYQIPGYYFLRSHYEAHTGVLLADDMGLGKTVQIISLLAYLYDSSQLTPALLVVPMSLIDNWRSELQKFLPVVRQIYVHQGIHRYHSVSLVKENQIVITTYETLARDQSLLGRIKWSCVICDEAQKVKNFNTLAAGAVKGMNTACRIAVTGTPVENRLSELWSIVDFVQPGMLGSYKTFRETYEKPIQSSSNNREELVSQLVSAVSSVFLRRKKEDVLAGQLPPKEELSIEIELTKSQQALYQQIVSELGDSDKNNALGTIQRLMMLCSHPRLITKQSMQGANSSELQKEASKLAWTIHKLKEIQKEKEKVIIYTRYITMQAMLRQAVYEEFHIDAPIINGSVKGNRVKTIQAFSQKPGFNVMILSPRAAGVGLNIVAANHVIHYTREWNPAVENQATDRAYRIGQQKPVTVYYPVAEAEAFPTVEDRLDVLLTKKRNIMKSVILPTNLEITAESFYDLL